MDPIIEITNLNFSYGTGELVRQVLKNINLTIHPGEIVIMTGPSGSGKTTLLSIIGALRSASKGSVKVFGNQLIEANHQFKNQTRLGIGFIFQGHNLIKSLSAIQNVCISLELRNNYTEEKRIEEAAKILTEVGLGNHLHSLPEQLSGGQKQRVSIARALVSNPQLILADEPTAALDKNTGQEIVHILKESAKERNAAILMGTHDTRILDIADRIIHLEDGSF